MRSLLALSLAAWPAFAHSVGTAGAQAPKQGKGDGELEEVSLLQTQISLKPDGGNGLPRPGGIGRPGFQGLDGSPLLSAAWPLAWIHFPKTGTSFANALIKLPGICPGKNVTFDSYGDNAYWAAAQFFSELHTGASCPGLFLLATQWSHRTLVGSDFMYKTYYLGHTVAMFRQPEQRLMSDFLDIGAGQDIRDFIRSNQGTYVKQLTRTALPLDSSQDMGRIDELRSAPTESEAALALQRVSEAFAFVGITEQWDVSMCLLHAMFGGSCHASDFGNVNPAAGHADLHNTSELQGFVDSYDGPIYAKALQIFNNRLEEFGVTPSSCQPCFEEAQLH